VTRARRDAVAVLGTFVVLGLVSGVVWWLLVEPAYFTKTAGGTQMSELDLGRRFDAVGWYVVIAAVGGFLAGLGLTWWRSRDHRLTTALVALGSAVSAVLSARVGGALGPGDPEVALRDAARGTRVPAELDPGGPVAYLVWPIAVLLGALMVLWSTSRVGATDLTEAPGAVPQDPPIRPFREREPR
jgi:hypothetical protein